MEKAETRKEIEQKHAQFVVGTEAPEYCRECVFLQGRQEDNRDIENTDQQIDIVSWCLQLDDYCPDSFKECPKFEKFSRCLPDECIFCECLEVEDHFLSIYCDVDNCKYYREG